MISYYKDPYNKIGKIKEVFLHNQRVMVTMSIEQRFHKLFMEWLDKENIVIMQTEHGCVILKNVKKDNT